MGKKIYTALMCLVSSYSWCQEEGGEKITGKDSLKTAVLSELVVSANKWEQDIREVPGTVSRISKSLIQFQNPQTSADLLTLTGKVYVQKSQLGGGSPMIRGFATNRVLLVVDGVRMNNAIFRGGNVQNVISLDANAVESNEVLFGPGSVIYGSDAIGGVMDFHTLTPKMSATDGSTLFKVNALSRYSSANNETTGHIDFTVGLTKWSFLSSVSWSDYDDLKMGSKGPDDYLRTEYVIRQNDSDVIVLNDDPELQIYTGYSQLNLMQKIRFKPSPSLELSYNIHYSKTSDYPRYDRLIRKRNGQLRSAEWYYGPQKWTMHSVNARYYAGKSIFDHVSVVTAYQDYEESRHDRNLNSDTRSNQLERVQAFSINADFDKEVNTSISLFYGGEAVYNKVGSRAFDTDIATRESSPAATRYPDGATWNCYSVYVGTKIRVHNNWLLNISNRFTNVITNASFDTTFYKFPFTEASFGNRATNSSVGLIYTPSIHWKVYSNFSTGFRAPNVDDIGKVFDSGDGSVIVPNPDLEPEYAYNAEVGIAMESSSRFSADAALYYTTINNAIARGYSTFNGQDSIVYNGELGRVLSQQNISEVYVYGFQLGMMVKLSSSLHVKGDYNYQRGKELDNETRRNYSPTHVAPSFGSLHIQYTSKAIKGDLYAVYNSEISFRRLALSEREDTHLYAKDDNGNPYAPSWTTFNLKLSFDFHRFQLTLGVENILDTRYRPYSSGITAPGRNFITSLRFSL